jgi:hypothetical protein
MQEFGWSEILAATGYTDPALRRPMQREQVEFEAPAVNGRTRANIWDIARLRVTRSFVDLGMESKEAFGLAKLLVDHAFKALIEGRHKFTEASAKKQRIMFAVMYKSDGQVTAPRIISADPSDTQDCASCFKELALQATNPQSIIIPLHWLVLDSWSKLPDLPESMRAWIAASQSQMQAIFK